MFCRLFCVLLFIALVGERPPDFDTDLYYGVWRSPLVAFAPLLVSIPGVALWPWQIILMLVVPMTLLTPGAWKARPRIMDAAIVTSLLVIGITYLWGWMRGGSAYQAYYQLWRLLTGLIFAFGLLQVTKTARDLKAIAVTVVACAVIRGGLAMYFYWSFARGYVNPQGYTPQYMTTHDDTLLFVAGILIVVCWALEKRRAMARILAVLVCAHLLYAIVVNNRRLAWVELILAFGVLYLLLPAAARRRTNRTLIFVAPVLVLYLAAGWGRKGAIWAPARALSTTGSDEDNSSLARQEEIRNLLYTLARTRNPLFGTGWGVAHEKVSAVYSNYEDEHWVQYAFMPHNSLLALIVFAGFAGLMGVWVVVPLAAYLGARALRDLTRPVERAAAMAAVCVLPAYSSQCYGDIGVQSLTCGLLLGVALAVAGVAYTRADLAQRRLRGAGIA
jgi:hypothetical protein